MQTQHEDSWVAVTKRFGLALCVALTTAGCAVAPSTRFFEPEPIGAPPVWSGPAPESVTATTDRGARLSGWYWPGARPGAPLLVFFPGRGDNRDTAAVKAQAFVMQGRGVLVASYEGFGANPGSPSEAALYRDGAAFVRLARTLNPMGNLYLFGDGLGSAVALHSAIGAPVAGVATLGAFDRLASFADRGATSLYAGQFDNVAAIAKVTAPVLLMHGDKDQYVTAAMTERLRAAAGGRVYVVPLTGEAYHSIDLKYIAPTVWEALDAFGGANAPPPALPAPTGRREDPSR